jgi:rhomboid protease GluP
MMLMPIYQNLTARQADTYGLILSSVGIFHKAMENRDGWQIWVYEKDEEEALSHIHKYEEENAVRAKPAPASIAPKIKLLNGIIGALFLMVVHVAVADNRDAFVALYGASASRIMAGEVFRTATALLLHADAAHLIGNMAAIALFGSVVCASNGFGVGWLMILLSGIFGNYLNAWFHESFHMSIGASTAVFGAVGMMAAHQFLRKIGQPAERYKAWLPLAGGMALLAIFGTGAGRMDIMAHLFGFACGLLLQILYQGAQWYWQKQVPARYNAVFLAIALLILGLSSAWPMLAHRG